MPAQTIICLTVFVITLILYMSNKFPLPLVSMTAMGVLLAAAGGAMAALAFFELCPEAWRYQIWGGRLGFLLGLFAMLVVCLKG